MKNSFWTDLIHVCSAISISSAVKYICLFFSYFFFSFLFSFLSMVIPKNERNSEILVGDGIFCILLIYVWEGVIPFSLNPNAKSSTLFINSLHFCLFKVTSHSKNRFKALSSVSYIVSKEVAKSIANSHTVWKISKNFVHFPL